MEFSWENVSLKNWLKCRDLFKGSKMFYQDNFCMKVKGKKDFHLFSVRKFEIDFLSILISKML